MSRKNIAIFVDGYPIKISPSILNFIELVSNAHSVTLFYRNIRPEFVPGAFISKYTTSVQLYAADTFSWPSLSRYLRHTIWHHKIRKRNTVVTDFLSRQCGLSMGAVIRFFFEGRRNISAARNMSFYSTVCFDLEGLYFMKEIAPEPGKIVFYSLELRLSEDEDKCTLEEKARRENVFGGVSKLIIQSVIRKNKFFSNYSISDMETFLLPVTYKGGIITTKSRLFHERLQLDPSRKICIHVGGIIKELMSIELALAFKNIKDWVLVFQGYRNEEYCQQLKNVLTDEKIDNVFISDFFAENPDDLAGVVSSCDAGISWYADISDNMRTAAHSSGKISFYLKCGLPIIANDYPSFREVVEENECGVCIDDLDKTGAAIDTVTTRYEQMRKNSFRLYDEQFSFDSYQSGLLKFLEN